MKIIFERVSNIAKYCSLLKALMDRRIRGAKDRLDRTAEERPAEGSKPNYIKFKKSCDLTVFIGLALCCFFLVHWLKTSTRDEDFLFIAFKIRLSAWTWVAELESWSWVTIVQNLRNMICLIFQGYAGFALFRERSLRFALSLHFHISF